MRRPATSSESGIVLILTLLFCATLATLALSSFSSVENQIGVSSQDRDALRAELAAEAGLEHAKYQLLLDPYWEGTNGSTIQIAGDQAFAVAISYEEDAQLSGVRTVIHSTGTSGDGQHTLRMDVEIADGGAVGETAAVFLSSEIQLTKSKINGDMLIPDMMGAIEDYCLDENGDPMWVLNEDPLGEIDVASSNALKKIVQFTETAYFNGNPEIELRTDPYKMPAWDLDSYTEPDPNHLILNGTTSLDGLTTDQTVVVILDPGQTLTVNDCNLGRGLVVWTPPEYNLRNGPRNQVIVSSSNIGTGSDPHIGLMAPGSEVTGSDAALNFHGLCFWNKIDGLDKAHITGALVVVNEVVNCDQLNLNGHPQTLANLPEGINFSGSGDGLSFLVAGEDYEDLN